jgi:hypothetical protein
MPVLTIAFWQEPERLGLELASVYFTQLFQVAQITPDGRPGCL